MSRLRNNTHRRQGATLLELMATLGITATLMTSSMVVVRSSHTVWQKHRAAADQMDAADTTIRHMVRAIRQTASLSQISLASFPGTLRIVAPDGSEKFWFDTANVVYCMSSPDGLTWDIEPMAENVTDFEVVGYEADGVTATQTLDEVRLIHCSITVQHSDGSNMTASSNAWIRKW